MLSDRRIFLSVVLLTAISLIMVSAHSASAQTNTASKIGNKFGRGIVNTTFGFVVDVPKTMYYQSIKNGPAYGSSVGFGLGIMNGVARTGAGFYDVLTFPIPYPADYKPLMSPGYVFEPGPTQFSLLGQSEDKVQLATNNVTIKPPIRNVRIESESNPELKLTYRTDHLTAQPSIR